MLHERLIIQERDFPGGPVVRSLPANAGDMGLIPGPHAVEQLNLCTTDTLETTSHNY